VSERIEEPTAICAGPFQQCSPTLVKAFQEIDIIGCRLDSLYHVLMIRTYRPSKISRLETAAIMVM
jgi:hypothetical protein